MPHFIYVDDLEVSRRHAAARAIRDVRAALGCDPVSDDPDEPSPLTIAGQLVEEVIERRPDANVLIAVADDEAELPAHVAALSDVGCDGRVTEEVDPSDPRNPQDAPEPEGEPDGELSPVEPDDLDHFLIGQLASIMLVASNGVPGHAVSIARSIARVTGDDHWYAVCGYLLHTFPPLDVQRLAQQEAQHGDG